METCDKRYLIDIGTDVTEQFAVKNLPLSAISAIFITHMHSDHTNGLLPFLFLSNGAFKDANPTIFLPGNIERTKTVINEWLKCNNVESIREMDYQPVNVGHIYDDGFIKVTAFLTKHINYSYSYLVEAEGKRVFFSGDLSGKGPEYDFPLSVLSSPLDLAICESAHFDATKYLTVFKTRADTKRLCFNHYSQRFLPSVIYMKNLLKDIEVLIANDGMEIII